MVARTRLNVTLYVHRLSCSLTYFLKWCGMIALLYAAVRGIHFDSKYCYMRAVEIDLVFDFPDSEMFTYSNTSSKFLHLKIWWPEAEQKGDCAYRWSYRKNYSMWVCEIWYNNRLMSSHVAVRSVLTISINLGANSSWDRGVYTSFTLFLVKVKDVECSDPPSKENCDLCRVRYEGWNFNSGIYLFTTDTN